MTSPRSPFTRSVAESAALALATWVWSCAGSSPRGDDPSVMEPSVGEPPVTQPGGMQPDQPGPSPGSCAETPGATAEGPPRWRPGTIGSFEIFQIESMSELERKLRAVDVVTLELDEVENAGGRTVTDAVRTRGARVICYTSSGFEDWRDDADDYPDDARGSAICRDDACRSTWPGEAWGDIRRPSLIEFLGRRADRAAAAGCDGIEFDNMDQAFNATGLNMSVDENREAALSLARLAHDRGLAALAKNTGELACALAPAFDGVFVEECQQNDECDAYLPYRGKLVAMVEYEASCRSRDWAACNEQDDYFDDDGR